MGNVLSRCTQSIRDLWQSCRFTKGHSEQDDEKCTYEFSRESLEKYKIQHSKTNESIANAVPTFHIENERQVIVTKPQTLCQVSPIEGNREMCTISKNMDTSNLRTLPNVCSPECSIEIQTNRSVLMSSSRSSEGSFYENQGFVRRDHYMLNSVSWAGSSIQDCVIHKGQSKTRSEIITNVHVIRGTDQHVYENQPGLRLSLNNSSNVNHNFDTRLGATKSDSAITSDIVSNLYNCYKINTNMAKNDLRKYYKCNNNNNYDLVMRDCNAYSSTRHSVACCTDRFLMQTKPAAKVKLSSVKAIYTKDDSNLENNYSKHVAHVKIISSSCSKELSEKQATETSDLSLVKRQQDLLSRLGDLQHSVKELAVKYGVSVTNTAEQPVQKQVSKMTKQSVQKHDTLPLSSPVKPGVVHDIVIHADPSSPPWSVFVLHDQLKRQFRVLPTSFTHSSVTATIPDRLRDVFKNGHSFSRREIQIAFTLIWKKVKNGPVLLVNTGKQSPIYGETNVARYLGRLLTPPYDSSDIVTATMADEWLDIAELQMVRGSKKEKMAVVKSMNTKLGRNDWLVGSAMSLVDIVMWSILHQSGVVDEVPANVKRWMKACTGSPMFSEALSWMS